eukprot:gene12610-12740_t
MGAVHCSALWQQLQEAMQHREATLADKEASLSSLDGTLQHQAQKYMLLEQLLTGLWSYVQSATIAQQVIRFWSPPALSAVSSEETKRQMEDPAARIAQRKTLAPGFSRQALRQVLGKVEAICRRKLDSWAAVGSAVDLTAEGRELSFDFSTELLVNFNVPEEQRATVKQQLDAMFKAMLAPPLNLPGSIFWKGQRARKQLIQDVVHIIEASDSSSSSRGNNSDSNPDVEDVGTSAFELILQSLREQQSRDGHLSAETVAQSGISLLLAGTDTSGGGVTALMEMVALFPEVMQKLRQEQQQVIAQYGTTLSLRALDAMPYAEAVIKEALRLAPPAGAVLRKTLVDLEIAGHFVPAGALLYLSTFTAATLTDPSLTGRQDFLKSLADGDVDQLAASWKQISFNLLQQEFKPDRWLLQPQAGAGKPSGLLTFSVGPHTCLGMSLFMTEAKVLLALLAREYELQPEAPQEASFTFTMLAQLTANAGSREKVLSARFWGVPRLHLHDSASNIETLHFTIGGVCVTTRTVKRLGSEEAALFVDILQQAEYKEPKNFPWDLRQQLLDSLNMDQLTFVRRQVRMAPSANRAMLLDVLSQLPGLASPQDNSKGSLRSIKRGGSTVTDTVGKPPADRENSHATGSILAEE